MHLLIATICIVLCVGCGAKSVQVNDVSAVSKKYAESQRLADEAFKELDGTIENKPAVKEAESPKPVNKPAVKDDAVILKDAESPKPVDEKKKPGSETKYPIVDGYPVWVMNPVIEGWKYLGVGSSKPQASGITIQKRAAKIQAQGEISRVIKIQIDNEISTMKTADNKGNTSSDFQTSSRQRSNELLRSVEEVDSWTSPDGMFYLLLGIKE